ncbi:MAG TPA: YdcF family protein, partial [Plasticicumulans sp.]|nr:YdcF family protein [Plasticicumulans sp.]
VALWQAGRGRWLLCSGGLVAGTRSEAAVMAGCARAAGVPAQCIVEEDCARNTWQNAQFSAALLRRHGWRTALLVTERYHLPRARLACRLNGLPVVAVSGPGHPPGRGRGRRLALALREGLACGMMLMRAAAAILRRNGAESRQAAGD